MNRLINAYYGFQVTFTLYVWMPIFFVYQQSIGLGTEEIFGIQAHYYLAFCLFEIPTGFVSDRFGHRTALRLGAFMLVVSHLFAVLWLSYLGMFLHWMVLALARSLVSGASSAYLYEHLQQRGAEKDYKRIEGNARAFGLVAKVVAWGAVGLLMEMHVSVPYWISTGFAFVAFLITLSLAPEVSGRAPRSALVTLQGCGVVFRNGTLLGVMLLGVGVFVVGHIVQVNAYQPLLLHHGIPLATHGLIMSGMTVLEALASGRAVWLRRMMDDLTAVVVLTFVACGSMGLMVLGATGTVVGLMVFALAAGAVFPIQKQLMNDAIGDLGSRATILSVESMVDRAFNALATLGLGAYVASGQLNEIMVVSAGAIAVGSLLCFVWLRRGMRRAVALGLGGAP